MMYKKRDAQKFSIPGGTKGFLYPSHPRGEQTVAYIEMDGAYPEKGYSINDVCTETLYMLEGSFEIECGGKNYTLKGGDLFMILPKNKYRTRGKGKALALITPAWSKKQNHIIDK